MANTVTQRTLYGAGSDRRIIRLINVVYVDSQETDLVIYDNSTFIADVTKGKLLKITASGSDCLCKLEWDQSTDSPIVSFNPSATSKICFEDIGGISNPGGTGATGDLLLTTTGLAAGEEITLLIEILQ